MAAQRARSYERKQKNLKGNGIDMASPAKTSSHPLDERWALKFRNRAAFGKFCVALRTEKVPFSLPGFQTIALAIPITKVGPESRRLYDELRTAHMVEEYSIQTKAKRRAPPSPDKARTMIQKFTENLKRGEYVK